MKRTLCTAAAAAFTIIGCSDQEISSTEEQFRTVEKVRELTVDRFGGRTARSLFCDGDTLFVVSADTAGKSALQLFSSKSGDSLAQVDSWSDGTAEVSFVGAVTCVTASKDQIFVGTKDSRIEVFNRQTLAWETTIGTGVWWGNDTTKMVHSFGLAVADSLLFLRDKMGVRVYALSTITRENKNKIRLFSKSIDFGEETYNHGIASTETSVYVTEGWAQKIYVFDRKSFVKDSLKNVPVDTISLNYHPLGLTIHHDQLFVTGENGSMECRSLTDGSLIRSYKTIEGYSFELPAAISSNGDNFFTVEQKRGSVVQGFFNYSTVKLY